MAIVGFLNLWVAPSFLALQFFAQLIEMRRRNGDPGALSLLSLCFQVPVLAATATRWYLRVRITENQSEGEMYLLLWFIRLAIRQGRLTYQGQLWSMRIMRTTWGQCTVFEMYIWFMPVLNYAMWAVGGAVLLASYYLLGGGNGASEPGERAPLLG